jgi:hypothetical protein
MKIANFLLTGLFNFFILLSFGQPNTPTTPSAAVYNYSKYADTPPNLYTGAVSEQIPIGSVSAGPLNHSVGIGYYFAGHRPSDLSSPVGLGFSLSGGGAITRQVLGLDDFDANGWNNKGSQVNNGLTLDEMDDVAEGLLDSQADIYSLNVGSISIKFAMDHMGLIHTIPRSDLKISYETYNYTDINLGPRTYNYFLLTDTEGMRYYFGDRRDDILNVTAFRETTSFTDNLFTSVWYLYRIETHDGMHQIDFDYDVHNYSYFSLQDCEEVKWKDGSQSGTVGPECEMTAAEISIQGRILTSVKGLASSIYLNYSDDRQDLLGDAKRLTSVEVKSGNFTRTYTLDNDNYFGDSNVAFNQVNDANELDMNSAEFSAMTKKLKLDGLSILGGTASIPDYTFDYYRSMGEITGTYNAYATINKGIDAYGFANGIWENNDKDHIVPTTTAISNGEIITFGNGNIRNPDANYSITSGLYKMTLPTGGTVTYEYEGNDYYDDSQNINTKASSSANNTNCASNSFTEAADKNVTFTQDQIDFGWIEWNLDSQCSAQQIAIIIIELLEGSSLVDNWTYTTTDFNSGTINLNSSSIPLQPNKTYKFKLRVLNGIANTIIKYSSNGSNEPLGGIRLKSKTTSDASTTDDNDIIRTYVYEDDNGNSTGRMYKKPVFGYSFSTTANVGVGNALFSTASIRPFTSYEGHFMGYTQTKSETDGNGYSISEFHTDQNLISSTIAFPPKPEQTGRNLWGQHRATSIYRETDNEELQRTINTISSQEYGYSIPSNMYVLREIGLRNNNGSTVDFIFGTQDPYRINTGTFRPIKTEQIIEGLSKTTNYEYNSNNHLLATSITETFPDNEFYETFITYTNEALNDPASDSIIARNIIRPRNTFYSMNGKAVFMRNHIYANFSNHPRLQKIIKTYLDESGNNLVETDINKTYNLKGLLTARTRHGYTTDDVFTYNSNSLISSSGMSGLTKSYAYHPGSRLVSKVTEIDQTDTDYTYDGMMRLKTSTNAVGAKTTYDYNINQNIAAHLSFIKTTTTFPADPLGLSSLTKLENFAYLDGLGRTIQTVGKQQTFDGHDQVNTMAYDNQGRVSITYETYGDPASDGTFSSLFGFQPFTEVTFEPSPLNRKQQVTPPNFGTTQYTYGLNTRIIKDAHGTMHPLGSLYQRTAIDGNGNKSQSFTDVEGRTIMSSRSDATDTLFNETTYAYDFKNLQIAVVPPSTSLDSINLIFNYEYDEEGKVIRKKIPSKDWIDLVYDDRDLLIGFQDSYMRSQPTPWYGYKYDSFGRQLATGFYNSTPLAGNVTPNLIMTETEWGTDASVSARNKGKVTNYKTRLIGTSLFIENDNFYDQYGRLSNVKRNNVQQPNFKFTESTFSYDGASNVVSTLNKFYATGAVITNVKNDTQYDNDGRVVSEWIKLNNTASKQLCALTYDDKNLHSIKYQGGNSTNHLQQLNYEYLSNKTLHKVNDGKASGLDLFGYQLNYNTDFDGWNPGTNQYNGNIKSTSWHNVGNNIYIQDYSYDYLDRLTEVNTSRKSRATDTNALSQDFNNSSYEYDDRGNFVSLIRMNEGLEIDSLSYIPDPNNLNQVSKITDTGLSLEGYRQKNSQAYKYDGNGNMITDPQKGITIRYNHLDLPDLVTWDDGKYMSLLYDADGEMHRRLVYDKDGNEIKKCEYLGQLEYLDGFKYAIHHSEGRIVNQGLQDYLKYLYLDHEQTVDGLFEAERIESIGLMVKEFNDYEASDNILLDDGFEVISGATFLAHIEPKPIYKEDWQYEWNITDHLGNLRVVYSDLDDNDEIDPATERIQLIDYYPYGMRRNNTESTTLFSSNQFNGIDHVNDFGLDWNMALYRSLQGDIGLWGQVDPKAELQYSMSPYCAMNNNPILYNDPEGDIAPLVLAGIAIGGGIINTASNWGNINSFAEGLNYFATGAAGYGVGAVNPVAGGLILAGGNFSNKAFNGDLPQINNVGDLFGATATVGLDFLGPYAAGTALSSSWGSFNAAGTLTKQELKQLAAAKLTPSLKQAAGTGLKKSVVEYVVKNTAVQTTNQVVKQTATSGLTNVIPRTKDVLGHIFKNSTGHVNPTTAASKNRYIDLFEEVANNSKNLNPNVLSNYQRTVGGFEGYSRIFRNGKQIWVHSRNGRIFDAGVNLIPK